MRDRVWRASYLIVAIGTAVLAGRLTDAPISLTRPTGRWLEILTITAVSALLFQPFYSGSAPAFANSLLAVLTALTIGFDDGLGLPAFLAVGGSLNICLLTAAYILKGGKRDERGRARFDRTIARGSGNCSWRLAIHLSHCISCNTRCQQHPLRNPMDDFIQRCPLPVGHHEVRTASDHSVAASASAGKRINSRSPLPTL